MNIRIKRIALITALTCLAPTSYAGTVTWTGTVNSSCTIDSDVPGTVAQFGTSNSLTSSSGDGGASARITITATDSTYSLHIGSPVVDRDGTVLTMTKGDESAFHLSNSSLGYSDVTMTPAGLAITAPGTYEFAIRYWDTSTTTLDGGNYTVTATSTCF